MPADRGYLFITGATGLIGHYLVGELLKQGHRCAVLLRPPLAHSFERLSALLWEVGCDVRSSIDTGRLRAVEGDLFQLPPTDPGIRIESIVHGAAATNFRTDPQGEPSRTNVDGTARLLEWADRMGIGRLHLISSAYVCGRAAGPMEERFHDPLRAFHNDYERSKWEAESLCAAWAGSGNRELTVYRPSVVVGEHASGRSSKFAGVYLSARATSLLDRMFHDKGREARHTIPLRLKGQPDGHQNIVPVDYVARMIAAIVSRPGDHGAIYHLTHPAPPTNQTIKTAYERHFDIGGGRFVSPECFTDGDLNEYEQRFYDASRSIEHYFIDTPTFRRDHTERIERDAGITCPAFDIEAIDRLVRYAEAANWGRPQRSRHTDVPGCAFYFESFLPTHVGHSRIARMTGLTAVVRFVIEDEDNGEWVCRFDGGRLAGVCRGRNGATEDFGYRATRDVFWDSISGRTHPDELFLTGRAEVFGNIERALKMAVILHEFTKEFPCIPGGAESEASG